VNLEIIAAVSGPAILESIRDDSSPAAPLLSRGSWRVYSVASVSIGRPPPELGETSMPIWAAAAVNAAGGADGDDDGRLQDGVHY
jgi:hypothetical protein